MAPRRPKHSSAKRALDLGSPRHMLDVVPSLFLSSSRTPTTPTTPTTTLPIRTESKTANQSRRRHGSQAPAPLDDAKKAAATQRLLQGGFDLSLPEVDKEEALRFAASKGYLDELRLLLEHQAKVTAYSSEAHHVRTALHLAAEYGHTEIIQALVDAGARIGCRDKYQCTPLHLAGEYGHVDSIRLLLSLGSELEAVDSYGNTTFHQAARYNQCDAVRVLIELGANVGCLNKSGLTVMHIAAYGGAIQAFSLLVESEAEIPWASTSGYTPLHSAVFGCKFKTAKTIIEMGESGKFTKIEFDINARSKGGWTPLLTASNKGFINLMELLLNKGADIDLATDHGETPLQRLCANGSLEAVQLLLNRGAELEPKCDCGYTALSAAAKSGSTEVVKALAAKGADLTTTAAGGWTPLHLAASLNHTISVRTLLGLGLDINAQEANDITPLSKASELGQTDTVRLLLDNGAGIHIVSKLGWTPLHFAARYAKLPVVELLLERGADPTFESAAGRNALSFAQDKMGAENEIKDLLTKSVVDWTERQANRNSTRRLLSAVTLGRLAEAKEIIKEGVNINAEDVDGQTALLVAAESGKDDTVKFLIDNGADVNRQDKEGESALWRGARYGHDGVVRLLLASGARFDIPDHSGQTALSAAAQAGETSVVSILMKHGADVNSETIYGKTALSFAAQGGYYDVVSMLITSGADPNHKSERGETPLALARKHDHPKTAQYLLEKTAIDSRSVDDETKSLASSDDEMEPDKADAIQNLGKAAAKGKVAALARFLRVGAEVNKKDKAGRLALGLAAEYGHDSAISTLLSNGAQINLPDKKGRTALWWAARYGNDVTAKLLHDAGAKIDLRDSDDQSPLSIASEYGETKVVDLLLSLGAKREIRSKARGASALNFSALFGHEDCVQSLIDAKVNIDSGDRHGCSPLFRAAEKGYIKIVRLLLDHGATLRPSALANMSPLCVAASKGNEAVVELLIKHGAQIDYLSDRRWTPLFIAASRGHEAVVRLLIEVGARVDLRDDDNRSVLSVAKEEGHEAVARLLRRAMSIASAAGQGAVSESLGGFDISVPEKRYHYQSLSKPTSIRLIELLPGGDKDMLSFEIHEVDLSHNPSYEALSYEWKDKSGTIPVRCHDRRLLVTPNLKAALEKLRLKKKKRTLWIDGICINQADVEERNQQVHLMTDIYRKAEKVLMWLGDELPMTKAAFEYIPRLVISWNKANREAKGKDILEYRGDSGTRDAVHRFMKVSGGTEDQRQGAHDLMNRQYFTRAWVYQEILLAQSRGLILCGKYQISWHKFKRFMALWTIWRRGVYPQNSLLLQDDVRAAKDKSIPLSWALDTMAHLQARDPRDKVYAALGITGKDSKNLAPDYSLTAEEVYVNVARHMIQMYRGLVFWASSNRAKCKKLTGLPSWVPDWTCVDRLADRMPHDEVSHLLDGALVTTSTTMYVNGFLLDKVAWSMALPAGEDLYDAIVRPVTHALAARNRSIFDLNPAHAEHSNLTMLCSLFFPPNDPLVPQVVAFFAWKLSTDPATPALSLPVPAALAEEVALHDRRAHDASDFDFFICDTMEEAYMNGGKNLCDLMYTEKGYFALTGRESAQAGLVLAIIGRAGRVALLREEGEEGHRWFEYVDFVQMPGLEWKEYKTVEEVPIGGERERLEIR